MAARSSDGETPDGAAVFYPKFSGIAKLLLAVRASAEIIEVLI